MRIGEAAIAAVGIAVRGRTGPGLRASIGIAVVAGAGARGLLDLWASVAEQDAADRLVVAHRVVVDSALTGLAVQTGVIRGVDLVEDLADSGVPDLAASRGADRGAIANKPIVKKQPPLFMPLSWHVQSGRTIFTADAFAGLLAE